MAPRDEMRGESGERESNASVSECGISRFTI